jgi:hypothetical protein
MVFGCPSASKNIQVGMGWVFMLLAQRLMNLAEKPGDLRSVVLQNRSQVISDLGVRLKGC